MRGLNASGRDAALAAGLAAAYVVSMAVTVLWARQTVGVVSFWAGGGLLMAALVVLPMRWGLACAAACFFSQLGFNLLIGQSLATSLAFSLLCLGEGVAGAWLARNVRRGQARLNGVRPLLATVFLVVTPVTALVALIAADIFNGMFERNFHDLLTDWLIAHTLGAAMVFPAAMILLKPPRHDEFTASGLERVGLLVLVAAVSLLSLQRVALAPALLLFFPVLLLVAFRTGPRGVAIGALTMTAVSLAALVHQTEGVLAPLFSLSERIRYVQLVVATCFFTSLAAAMSVEKAARIRRLWATRTRIAHRGGVRAAAAARAKADFVSAMSHEIRTPMNSIIGFSQVLLKRDDMPESARRQLSLIDRAGTSLLTVVNDILDLSQLQADGVELHPRATTAQAIARDALAIVAERARRKGVGLELTLGGQVEQACRIDDLRLRQILLTLLANAVKFTDAGRVRLDVLARLDRDAPRLRFTVTDTGQGIAPARLGALFDRLTRPQPPAASSPDGETPTFGLALAKGLIELLGGEIGVESAEGRGSTFWVEAPVEIVVAPIAPAEVGGLGARVLLVDDQREGRELTATLLDLLGCQVVAVDAGEPAVGAARAGGFDVVLVDLASSDPDDLDMVRRIRALPPGVCDTPIIALTADSLAAPIEANAEMAGIDYLAKPIRLEALHAALSRRLARDAAA